MKAILLISVATAGAVALYLYSKKSAEVEAFLQEQKKIIDTAAYVGQAGGKGNDVPTSFVQTELERSESVMLVSLPSENT